MPWGSRCVAEGIETEHQALEVARLGCDLAQGFLFARPGPAEALNGAGRAQRPVE